MDNKKLSYTDYLHLNKLLDSQELQSDNNNNTVHDEMLFIIIHQAYELWFKQIIHELDSIIDMFKGDYVKEQNLGVVVSRLNRIIEIQKLLINQIAILETMTPMDFLEFRDYLNPASGFQSAQFRLIENKLGLNSNTRIKFGQNSYDDFLEKNEKETVKKSENNLSLFLLIEDWLGRTPFLQSDSFDFWGSYKLAVSAMIETDINKIKNNEFLDSDSKKNSINNYDNVRDSFDSLFDTSKYNSLIKSGKVRLSQKAALGALFIKLYRDEPILQLPHKLLSQLIDMDQLWTTWRNKHALLVFRMIGVKIGTGGSVGHKYLKKTAQKHTVFSDIANLSTYIIPRNALPKLPNQIKENLGFYFTYRKET